MSRVFLILLFLSCSIYGQTPQKNVTANPSTGALIWPTSVAATPGGTSGQIQYNNSSALAGFGAFGSDTNSHSAIKLGGSIYIDMNTGGGSGGKDIYLDSGKIHFGAATHGLTIEESPTGSFSFDGAVSTSSIRIADSVSFLQLQMLGNPILFNTGASVVADGSGHITFTDATVTMAGQLILPQVTLAASGLISLDVASSLSSDGSGHASLNSASLSVGVLFPPQFTVSTLPSVAKGAEAVVTDSLTALSVLGVGVTPTGGGTNIIPVIFDGTNWISY